MRSTPGDPVVVQLDATVRAFEREAARIRAVGHQAAGGNRRRDDARHRVDRSDQSIDHDRDLLTHTAGVWIDRRSDETIRVESGIDAGEYVTVRPRNRGKDHRERQGELRATSGRMPFIAA